MGTSPAALSARDDAPLVAEVEDPAVVDAASGKRADKEENVGGKVDG